MAGHTRAAWLPAGRPENRKPAFAADHRRGCPAAGPATQRVEQPVLGELDLAPSATLPGDAGIWTVRLWRQAGTKMIGPSASIIQLHTPSSALAQNSIRLVSAPRRRAMRAARSSDRDVHDLRDEAQIIRTLFADRILEVEQLLTMLALEELHCRFAVFFGQAQIRSSPARDIRHGVQIVPSCWSSPGARQV